MRPEWVNDKNLDDSSQKLALAISRQLTEGISARGEASLVLSGGRTPLLLFELLAKSDIEWKRVKITLADERWISENHPRNNGGQVRSLLLQGRAEGATFYPLYSGAPTPQEGVKWANRQLAHHFPSLFDVVVLGMGEDGHTASLFPGSKGLEEALGDETTSGTVAIESDLLEEQRITLSLNRILMSRHLFLQIVGDRKRDVLRRAFTPGEIRELPIRAILDQQRSPLTIYYANH